MAMTVRIPDGTFDEFQAIEACACGDGTKSEELVFCRSCAKITAAKYVLDDTGKRYQSVCSKCGNALEYASAPACTTGQHIYEPRLFDAEGQQEGEALLVTRRGETLGFYPAGSWVSWRRD
jgi:transcription elongation factor Elf1